MLTSSEHISRHLNKEVFTLEAAREKLLRRHSVTEWTLSGNWYIHHLDHLRHSD